MPDMVELFVAAPDDQRLGDLLAGAALLRGTPDDWSWSSALPPDARAERQSRFAFVSRCDAGQASRARRLVGRGVLMDERGPGAVDHRPRGRRAGMTLRP